jgi:hypothetical protein
MDFLKDLLKDHPKDVPERSAWAARGTARLIWITVCLMAMGCGMRDLSAPIFPTGSDSVAVSVPVPQKTGKDTSKGPVEKILIESLSASDLRLTVGQTKPASVLVLPSFATTPQYEMTSSKPGVAEVTAGGIRGAAEGSATITVRALDGSGKSTRFHVIVDALVKACVTLPCLCVAAKQGDKGDKSGQGKGNGDVDEKAYTEGCPD